MSSLGFDAARAAIGFVCMLAMPQVASTKVWDFALSAEGVYALVNSVNYPDAQCCDGQTALLYLAPESDGVVDTVPEPGSWSLMLLGFGLAGLSLRRRRDRLAIGS